MLNKFWQVDYFTQYSIDSQKNHISDWLGILIFYDLGFYVKSWRCTYAQAILGFKYYLTSQSGTLEEKHEIKKVFQYFQEIKYIYIWKNFIETPHKELAKSPVNSLGVLRPQEFPPDFYTDSLGIFLYHWDTNFID